MVVRRAKKIRKKRGSRTCGYGITKKHRGAGSRGGRGKAGLLKHKKTWMIKYDPDHFGKKGFKVPVKAKNIRISIKQRLMFPNSAMTKFYQRGFSHNH